MSTVASGRRPASVAAIDAELARRDLREYRNAAWPLVLPGREFIPNWHLDVIAEYLQAVSDGEITRLVLNVPPRTMKSLSTSVFWPTWEWANRPETQFLFFSHTASLARRDAARARRIMEAPGGRQEGSFLEQLGYRRAFEVSWGFTDDQNRVERYENTEGGHRISSGLVGTATGEGGDIVVIDDPQKLEEAESEAKQRAAVDFVRDVIPSRLNSADSAIVIIMQRLHEGDVTGALLGEEGAWLEEEYTHVCLPMEFEPKHPFRWPEDRRQEAGDLLWADRFPKPRVRSIQRQIGSFKYAGQYQQRPSPAEGGELERGWWQTYEVGEHPPPKALIASWDMAFKDELDSDFVAGEVWMTDLADRYLLGMIRARLSFTNTLDAVQALNAWVIEKDWAGEGHAKLVEDKANGTAVINTLRRTIPGLIAVEPQGGKLARVRAVAPQVESGNVYLPRGFIPAPLDEDHEGEDRWEPTPTEAFIEEAANFPLGVNDDMVDAMSQALIRLQSKGRKRLARTA